MFECGPLGKGTVSSDWTKFNPNNCRKLFTNTVDESKVMAKYGTPPSFICKTSTGYLFIGNTIREAQGNAVVYTVRLNQQKKGLIPKADINQLK